jgi:hypothetical protein
MWTFADTFFSSQPAMPDWELQMKLSSWHHGQVLASPFTLLYEEGTSIGPGLSSI